MFCLAHQLQRIEILRRHPLPNIPRSLPKTTISSGRPTSATSTARSDRDVNGSKTSHSFRHYSFLLRAIQSPSPLGFVSQPHGRGHPSSPAARKKRSRHDTKRVNIQQSVLSNRATHRMRRFPFARVWLTCSPEGRTSTI